MVINGFPTPPSGRRLLVSAPWRARQLLCRCPSRPQVQHLRVFFPSAFWDIKDSTLFKKLLICRSNRSTPEFDVSDSLTACMGCLSFRVACWAASNFIAITRAPFTSLRSAIRRAFWISDHAPRRRSVAAPGLLLLQSDSQKTPSEKSLSTSVASSWRVSDTFCCRDFSWSLL
ncbi:hypothetical protein TNCV_524471 [Trichonephila clavipes]|nr:hypothetical protein TNCV_524471 [Trichonephila clavipes]